MESILLAFLFLILSAFFSASETAMTAASIPYMQNLSKNNNKTAQLVLKLLSKRERLILISLILNNAVNILGSSYITFLTIRAFGEDSVVYATSLLTILIIIFGEVIPKQLALLNANKLSLIIAYPFQCFIWVLTPLTILVELVVNIFIGRAKNRHATDANQEFEDELKGFIDMHRGNSAEINEERRMLKSILELDDITVEQVMTHRKNVFQIPTNMPVKRAINKIIESKFSKIPLYDPKLHDKIVGVIHLRNIVEAYHNNQNIELKHIAQKPFFVIENTTILKLISSFRTKNEHFAVVVDEYGDFMGIITLEDIIEEIIGDIDENQNNLDAIEGVQEVETGHIYDIFGEVPIRALNRHFEWNLPMDNATTIAGLVIDYAKKIPQVGDFYHIQNVVIHVTEKQRHKITKLRLFIQKNGDEYDPETN